MRYRDFKIVETKLQEANEVYVIGDSHAAAMGGSNNLAANGARLSAVASQARQVPEGSIVYMTGGHNDVAAGAQPQAIASQVSSIINSLTQKDCVVTYILFPEGTDNTNQENMAPTRQAIAAAVPVGQDLDGCSMQGDGIHCQLSAYRGIVRDSATPNQTQEQDGVTAGPPYPQEDMERVRAIQTKLEELGYSVGSTGIDGKYGPRTSRAVKAFKQDNNIPITDNGRSMSEADIDKLETAEPVENPTSTGNSSFDPRVANGDPDFESPSYPPGMSRQDIEEIIVDEAELRGIVPSVAVRIFRAEGAGSYQSRIPRTGRGSLGGREASFGPYQLYIGGGLGNDYQQQTGRDLTTDNTEEGIVNQIRFALDAAVTQSWQPWYGRGPAGVGRTEGLRGARRVRNWS
jgi:peptidoglycan hydrolase-like protein with peptidoglycan-binding domain